MPLPYTELQSILDNYLPNTGNVGYIALIQNVTHTSTYTVDSTTDVITLGATPSTPLATGCRFRVTNSGGAVPGVSGTALSTTTDYFWRVITATTGKMFRTLADAQANTNAVDFVNNGTGTQTFTEQSLNASTAGPDPLNVVLSKELPAGLGYSSRIAVGSLGASNIVSNRAEKNVTFTLTSTDSTGYTYRYYQLIKGGSATIGDQTGTQSYLTQESSNVTVNSSTPRFVFIRWFQQSP